MRMRANDGVRRVAVLAGVLPGWLLCAIAVHAQPPLPQQGPDQHLGVVTCAGSTCHGATVAGAASPVLQNEFVTWHREDKHAQAYKVLLNDRSKRIARNLGIEAAEKAAICLDCHADNVAPALRGKRFQISDGVGCEACHGGAERYLGPHLSGETSHAKNVELGMYPTDEPRARARLCLSCHLGTRDKMATHRIMGAGHPRISFELDTFSDIQPAHFRIDDDYRKRKQVASGAQLWAAGQAAATGAYLDLFRARQGDDGGLFPELAFFSCHGCHRSLHEQRWQPRPDLATAPGTVRLNDAHLLMLRHAARVAAPRDAAALDEAAAALVRATGVDMASTLAAAGRLRTVIGDIEGKVSARGVGGADISAMLASVVGDGARGAYVDYAAAEQAAMAAGSLINAMRNAGAVTASRAEELGALLDRIYEVLNDDAQYQPARLVEAMRAMQGAL